MFCLLEDNNYSGNFDDSIVPWWSFGKTVLATAILKLVAQNKLDLEHKYFNNDATLFQVLGHQGGYGEYAYSSGYQQAVDQEVIPWSYDEMVVKTHNQDLKYKAGSSWQYSNIGYYHLKILIEKTTKLKITEALNNLIFHPLGIVDVKVAESKKDLRNCTYVRDGYDPNWLYHGMIVGPLKRACQFLKALSQEKIINKVMLTKMQDVFSLNFNLKERPWKNPGYALGLMVDDQAGGQYSYGHTGMGPDSVIAVYHFPKKLIPQTIAVIMNTNNQSQVENKLIDLLDKEEKMDLYNREQALKLLEEHVKTKQLLKHSYAVEGSMKHYGELFNESIERYGTCGLLHDIDFEEFPDDHPGIGLTWLEAAGYDESFVAAVKGHGCVKEKRETLMAKTLFAVDELSSFVIAAALVRPTKFEGMAIKSIKKKMKVKSFAAAVNRDTIILGAELLGITLDEHIQNVIDALIKHEAFLNTKDKSMVA